MRFLRSSRHAGSSAQPPRLRRSLRWVLGSLACLAGAATLIATVAVCLLHSLDRPWLKRRLVGLARTSAGVDVDYHAAHIDLLSGAEIEGLVVQSPAGVRPFAPELVRVGRLDARWSLRSLLFARGPLVKQLTVSDVTVTVVVDEQGRTSFDSFGTSSTPSPTVPLSRKASGILGSAPPVALLDVDRVTVALIRTERGAVFDRTMLRGTSIHLTARTAEPKEKGWGIRAELGTPMHPLELELSRAREGAQAAVARARFWLNADATSASLDAALDMRMIDQTFVANVSVDHWLHAEAELRFDPGAGRTEIRLDHTEAGDGAANAEAVIEISDGGDAFVRGAHGEVDAARMLRWLPTSLVPVTADRARVRYQIDSLAASPVPHLSEGGAIAVDADLSNVSVHSPRGKLHVAGGALSLHAQPAEGGLTAQGSVRLDGIGVSLTENHLAVDHLDLELEGRQRRDGEVAGHVSTRFALCSVQGALPLVARDGHIELRVQRLYPDPKQALASRADLALSIDLASLDTHSPQKHAIIDGLNLRAHSALDGHAPYAAELDADVSRLRVVEQDGNVVVDEPLRVEGRAHDVFPDTADALASRGAVHGAIDLGGTRVSLTTTKEADAVAFELQATAPTLKMVRPLLPPALIHEAPWDQMSIALRSSGRIERLGGKTPLIRQATEVAVDHPAFRSVAADALSLSLNSRGTLLRHEADLDLRMRGLGWGDGGVGDEHAALSITVDRERPTLQFLLATDGRTEAKLSGSVSFNPARQAVPYAIVGRAARLAALAPLAEKVRGLDAFDLSQLEVNLSSRGALLGVVAAVTSDGAIALQPNPAATAALEGQAEVRVDHFRWAKGDTAIMTPSLAWHGEMGLSGAGRTLHSGVEVDSLHLDLGSQDVDLSGIRDDTNATVIGNLTDPEIEVAQRLSVASIEQTVVPEYPLGGLTIALTATRSRDRVVHISDLKIANDSGGTKLGISGNIELSEARRSLSLTGSLAQDLARLSRIPERFKGRGKLAVEANITSPDFAHYHVRAIVKGEDVTATLARAGVDMESANGEVPITVALAVDDTGIALERIDARNPYSLLRFTDQHPLLSRSGFLSIARLKTPLVSIAPLVGNLQIDQNIVSLSQFELGMRGGRITGQCALDWDGLRSTLELHVRASGVQSTHGEPFDGNIAVAISAADRTINGRAEILRIGERHLLDLLDLQDPLHTDPAMNRIRTALNFGYPKSLRLLFDHGFASAHLELGGLAQLFSIGDPRGIPMGPIVDKMLAPVLAGPNQRTNREIP